MKFMYTLGIRSYGGLIKVMSAFKPKAKAWVDGRVNWRGNLSKQIDSQKKRIWFHCASVGEFEQARPIIERLYGELQDHQIVVTFFSPSGFEYYSDYKFADVITYLPLDVPSEVEDFLSIVSPDLVLFVKYEFWFNFIESIQRRNIPIAIFSAAFRKDQIFFKRYGKWAMELLKGFDKVYLQDKSSEKLLQESGLENFEFIGDTRFDRVNEIKQNINESDSVLKVFKEFSANHTVVICGSSWEKEDEFITKFMMDNHKDGVKYIIAPHEMNESKIRKLADQIRLKTAFFSSLNSESAQADVIIVDGIGYLSRLYKYADIAVIGGGFNDGIHNTLEPATYGMPILFGPMYKKFNEAVALIEEGVGYNFNTYEQFESKMQELLAKESLRSSISKKCIEFVNKNLGASNIVYNYVKSKLEK